jgi:tripartite-type tricarboxylate transporter receptor subunit TctC
MRGWAIAVALAACTGPACNAGSAETQDPRAFFEGKTLTYVVATEPGGGYDIYGRLVARFLGKHLRTARVLVKNVPGGGHIVGANEIYRSRPDGLTLGSFSSGLVYATLLEQQGLAAKLEEMSWIGKAGGEARVLVVSTRSGFSSVEDIRASGRALIIGETGVGSAGYNDSMLMTHALGLRGRTVLGLASREAQLAMMRGEIDASYASASSIRAFIKNGYGRAIARVGDSLNPLDGPDATPLATSAEADSILPLVRAIASLSRWTAGPPAIPAGRLAVLREAYAAALDDQELREAAIRLDIPIVPMGGAELSRAVSVALVQPPELRALLARIAGGGHSTSAR